MQEQTVMEEGFHVHYFGKIMSTPIKFWYSRFSSKSDTAQEYYGYDERPFYYIAETWVEGFHFLFGSWDKKDAKHPNNMKEMSTFIDGSNLPSKASPSILLSAFKQSYTNYKKNQGRDLNACIQLHLRWQAEYMATQIKTLDLCTLSLII